MACNRIFTAITLAGIIAASASCQNNTNGLAKDILGSVTNGFDYGVLYGITLPPGTNALVFTNNPVIASQQSIAYPISSLSSTTSANNYDQYLTPVMVSGTTGGQLQNSDITITTDVMNLNATGDPSGLLRATPDKNGNYLFSTSRDKNHRLGQVMAFYWINKEKDVMNTILPNSWSPAGHGIKVYSRCYDGFSSPLAHYLGTINALWLGQGINATCMGYAGPLETAYDASIFAHEMGHAHIDYATMGALYDTTTPISTEMGCGFSAQNRCCKTSDGCLGAIDEGQADYHSFILFNSGKIAEYFINDPRGFLERDAEINYQIPLTAMNLFNGLQNFGGSSSDPLTGLTYAQLGPEIHYMGGVWGAAWWHLRQSLGADVTDKIFLQHISTLARQDNFKTALNKIVTADNVLYNASNHQTQILAVFAQHGITP